MVTGKTAFSGNSKASLIAAILEHEPPPISAPPPPIDQVIRACLAKDPDERIQTVHDVVLQLKWISERPQPAGAKRPFQWGIAALGLIVLIVGSVLAWRGAHSGRSASWVQRFSIPVAGDAPLLIGWQPLAVSPDGSRLVFEGNGEGGRSILYLRSTSEGEGKPIAGTEGAHTPFFSPDGNWLGFFADRKLKKISLSGGEPATIIDVAEEVRGAAWGGGDTIVYGAAFSGLMRVSAAGGAPRPLTTLGENESNHR